MVSSVGSLALVTKGNKQMKSIFDDSDFDISDDDLTK